MHVQLGLVIHLLVKRPSVAGEEPVDIALGVGAKRKATEQCRRRNLRGPEIRRGEAGIDLPARDLVEDLLRLSAVARLLQVELDSAAGELLDELGKPRSGLAEPRQMGPVDDGHLEAQGLGRKAGPGEQGNEQRGPQAKGRPGPRHYPLLVLVVA